MFKCIKIILIYLTLLFPQFYFGKTCSLNDTTFKWQNVRLISFGLEASTGFFKNHKINLNNFNGFGKVEFGARLYIKKIVCGLRYSFLISQNKSAGDLNNLNIPGEIDNRQTTFFTGYMVTSPKYVVIEPALFYSNNKGQLYYDSLKYGSYSKNKPTEIYNFKTLGLGFNTYLNLTNVFPKTLTSNVLYVFTQINWQQPIKNVSIKNNYLLNFSFGITLFPFFTNEKHF